MLRGRSEGAAWSAVAVRLGPGGAAALDASRASTGVEEANEVVLGHRSAETDVSVAADALWAWADASGEAPATQKHWELEPEPQAQPLERSL